MSNYFVERQSGREPERIYASPDYVTCMGFIVDYIRAKGPQSRSFQRSLNNWSVYFPVEGQRHQKVEVLRIGVDE